MWLHFSPGKGIKCDHTFARTQSTQPLAYACNVFRYPFTNIVFTILQCVFLSAAFSRPFGPIKLQLLPLSNSREIRCIFERPLAEFFERSFSSHSECVCISDCGWIFLTLVGVRAFCGVSWKIPFKRF